MPAERVVNGIEDVLAIAGQMLESATKEVVWIGPASAPRQYPVASLKKLGYFTSGAGTSRGVTPISDSNLKEIRTS